METFTGITGMIVNNASHVLSAKHEISPIIHSNKIYTSNISVFQHFNTPIHQYINTPTLQHTNTSIHQHTNTPILKCNAMFLQSEMKEMSRFLRSVIFNRPMKVVKIDKATQDYYMRLTNLYSQFQAVGVNYNQIVKAVNANFSEKRAAILLRQLEKATFEFVAINKKVIALTEEFDQRHMQGRPSSSR